MKNLADEIRRRRVRAAINRIEPLPYGDGPNMFTITVEHGNHSAPTKAQLALTLWHLFKPDSYAPPRRKASLL